MLAVSLSVLLDERGGAGGGCWDGFARVKRWRTVAGVFIGEVDGALAWSMVRSGVEIYS